MGDLHRVRGDLDKALPLFERARAIWERVHGPQHPNIGASEFVIGSIHQAMGRLEVAEKHLRRALALFEATGGPYHLEVARPLNQLGDLDLERGRPRDAIASFTRVLDLRDHGDPRPEVIAEARFGLARALWEQGDERDRALELARTALDEGRRDRRRRQQAPANEEWQSADRQATLGMMSPTQLTTTFMFALAFGSGGVACDSGPCSGGGMAKDTRELPADWAKLMTAPEGGVACHQADGSKDSDYDRSYELGKTPNEGFDKFREHLTKNGWLHNNAALISDDTYLQGQYEREGAVLKLQCSKKIADKGWCTLHFTPPKK